MSATTTPVPMTHPVVAEHLAARAGNVQLRIADTITRFAGSMAFVYIHIVLFAVWMIGLERDPWPTLTLVVSLEAIFLSTFVMICQNRQSALEQAKANHDYAQQAKHLRHNTELTESIHALAQKISEQQQQIHELLERQTATPTITSPRPPTVTS